MKLGIMQPYFFPYLGYFQLIHAVDKFVFYDDVNFIKNGWINRNRLLAAGNPQYFTVPLSGASPFTPIDQVKFAAGDPRWKRKMVATFAQAYADAPQRAAGMELLESALATPGDGIAELARGSVLGVLRYLGLERRIVATSRVYGNEGLKGPARVMDICRRENAAMYVNSPGGRDLYNTQQFSQAGIELRFLRGNLPGYAQPAAAFVPGLSILDVVMRCPREQALEMLSEYSLVH